MTEKLRPYLFARPVAFVTTVCEHRHSGDLFCAYHLPASARRIPALPCRHLCAIHDAADPVERGRDGRAAQDHPRGGDNADHAGRAHAGLSEVDSGRAWADGADRRPDGLVFTANGQQIAWRRDDVDMYAFHVNVPAGATELQDQAGFSGDGCSKRIFRGRVDQREPRDAELEYGGAVSGWREGERCDGDAGGENSAGLAVWDGADENGRRLVRREIRDGVAGAACGFAAADRAVLPRVAAGARR